MRREMKAALRGENWKFSTFTDLHGRRLRPSLVTPDRPRKVPDVPRNLTLEGESAQWWAEAPRPHAHWYLTTAGRFVAVTFNALGDPIRVSAV